MQSEFSKSVKANAAKRASYICSNPACRCLTISLHDEDIPKVVFKGKAIHICAPSHLGARYDAAMTSNQRKAIENAIFLCNKCTELVNRNKGADFPAAVLRDWKEQHKRWIRQNLNQAEARPPLTVVARPARVVQLRA